MTRNKSWPRFFLFLLALIGGFYFFAVAVKYEMYRDRAEPAPPRAKQLALAQDALEPQVVGPLTRVRPNQVVRRHECTGGKSPSIMLIPDKDTQAGNWSVTTSADRNWSIGFNGASTPQTTIQYVAFCQ